MIQNHNLPIGIIGAMDIEVNSLLSSMENPKELKSAGISFFSGLLSGVPCVLAKSGVGKVNAAVCAQTMILKFNPRVLINIGVAGGLSPEIHVGDFVVAASCVQYDFDTSALDNTAAGTINILGNYILDIPCDKAVSEALTKAAGEVYGNVFSGVIATGDSFIADTRRCSGLYRDFNALACEMEGASIAQVCLMNNTPAAILRAISDNANDTAHIDFPSFVTQTAEKTQLLMHKVLPLL